MSTVQSSSLDPYAKNILFCRNHFFNPCSHVDGLSSVTEPARVLVGLINTLAASVLGAFSLAVSIPVGFPINAKVLRNDCGALFVDSIVDIFRGIIGIVPFLGTWVARKLDGPDIKARPEAGSSTPSSFARQLEDLQSLNVQLSTEIQTKESDLADSKEQLLVQQARVVSLEQNNQALSKKLEEDTAALEEQLQMQAEYRENLEKACTKLQSDLKQISELAAKEHVMTEQRTNELRDANEKLDAAHAKSEQLSGETAGLKAKLEAAGSEISQLSSETVRLKAELETADSEISQLSSRAEKAEKTLKDETRRLTAVVNAREMTIRELEARPKTETPKQGSDDSRRRRSPVRK